MGLRKVFAKNLLGNIKRGKACFQHDMAHGDFKELPRGTTSDKVLLDKAFEIAKSPKQDEFGIVSMVYENFNKKVYFYYLPMTRDFSDEK